MTALVIEAVTEPWRSIILAGAIGAGIGTGVVVTLELARAVRRHWHRGNGV